MIGMKAVCFIAVTSVMIHVAESQAGLLGVPLFAPGLLATSVAPASAVVHPLLALFGTAMIGLGLGHAYTEATVPDSGGVTIRKRDAQESSESDVMEPYFEWVKKLDKQYECGLKMVCEIGAKTAAAEPTDITEKIIASIFKRNRNLTRGYQENSSVELYDLAYRIGVKDGRQMCGKVFSKCFYTSHQMLSIITNTLSQV